MQAHALIMGLVLLVPALAAGLFLREEFGIPAWLPALLVAVAMLWPVLIAPSRRFAAWGYHETGDALEVAHGVWTRIATVVPYRRVQHIDVSQGPVERMFGVARLVLHTAGTAHSQVVLPGLTREHAETMRERIRTHIRGQAE